MKNEVPSSAVLYLTSGVVAGRESSCVMGTAKSLSKHGLARSPVSLLIGQYARELVATGQWTDHSSTFSTLYCQTQHTRTVSPL